MKLFEKIALWWHNITKKRKVTIVEPDSGDERWYALLSPIAMVMSGIALVFIVFAILLAMVAVVPTICSIHICPGELLKKRQMFFCVTTWRLQKLLLIESLLISWDLT